MVYSGADNPNTFASTSPAGGSLLLPAASLILTSLLLPLAGEII